MFPVYYWEVFVNERKVSMLKHWRNWDSKKVSPKRRCSLMEVLLYIHDVENVVNGDLFRIFKKYLLI